MPDLIHSLQGRDLGHLRIVAELWGVTLNASAANEALEQLAGCLLDGKLLMEIVETLAAEARQALITLASAGGRMTWAAFARQAGELRESGPGRRDREQIHLHPGSAAEILFYRALIGRAFFETPQGLQEFAYIPDDLLVLLRNSVSPGLNGSAQIPQQADHERQEPAGRLATPRERQEIIPVCNRLLDDATTLLAALRMDMEAQQTGIPVGIVSGFLQAGGILEGSTPRPEALRSFLEMPRPAALKELVNAWRESRQFNELRLIPELTCEGEWSNDPLATRQILLERLRSIPRGRWWSLPAFIQDIKTKTPDIQRTAGDYDAWFIKRRADGAYLSGFNAWEQVEGALIQFLICGPMYWLGLVELAQPAEGEPVTAFLIPERTTGREPAENGKLQATSQGRIQVPRSLPRAVRYLLARFCEWEPEKNGDYRYRVSTASLTRAGEQGLKAGQLLSLLAKHAAVDIPPSFIKAIKRWERNGTEARLEVQTILHVSRPEVLEELRRSKAGRFLGEVLGPVTVTVQAGARSRVLSALAELGLLAEEKDSPEAGGQINKGI